MKNNRILIAALAACWLAAGHSLHADSSTWNGTVSTAWTNAANWSPGIPGFGDDLIIANTTGSGNTLQMADSRTIGNLRFGDTGNRTTTFQITGVNATDTLTFTNGFTALGSGGSLPTTEFMRVPVVIANDQTWTIGGALGTATGDAGIRLRERSGGNPCLLTLNGTLTKAGGGQLSFVGINNPGGDIVVQQGSLKLNAGGSTLLTMVGPGAITVNSGAWLMFSRNSGTFNITRPVVLNHGATVQFGGGAAANTILGSPFTWNGTVSLSMLNPAVNYTFTNSWSGNATINVTSGNANAVGLELAADNSALAGTINHNGNNVSIRLVHANAAPPTVAWTLGHAAAVLETYGPANVQLGSLAGTTGTVRNGDPSFQPATVTVGALGTDTSFGGVLADGNSTLGLIKTGGGTLTLTGASTHSGGITVNSGMVRLEGAAASAGIGPVTVNGGGRFGGSGTANGSVSVRAGGTLVASGGTGAPALNLGPLALGEAAGQFTTNIINVHLGGRVIANAGLTVNGTSVINITGAAPAVGTYDLIVHNGSIGGAGFPGFQLGALPFGVVANLQNGATAVQLVVTAVTIEPGVWVGNATGTWNLDGTLDWKGATSGTPQAYRELDPVTFDSSAATFTVNLVTNVQPSSVRVVGDTSYTFTGVGGIGGLVSLGKDGAGTLTIANNNHYTGGTFITNGTVQLGNGGTSGLITGPVVNDGALRLNRSDAFTLVGAISGIGSVTQQGTGRAVLATASSYEGVTTIQAGTLAPGAGTAFGSTNGGTVVVPGATLDVNTQNLGMEPVSAAGAGVGGAGAIVNNGTGDQQNALRYVTLTGDTTFGGAFRWDIRNPSAATDPAGGTHAFLHGNGHKLTKVGTNTVALIQVGDTGLGDIEIQGGVLTFSRSSMPGNPTGRLSIWPDARLQFHRLNEYMANPFNKVIGVTNGTLAIEANGLTNEISGPVTLTGSNVVSVPGPTNGMILSGTVGGAGSLNAVGPGPLIISGNATPAGGISAAGGLLQVDGTLAGGGVAGLSTATLGGTGSLSGAVSIPSGSTLSPGSSASWDGTIGTLSVGSLTLQPGSTSRFEVNTDMSTNDRLNATGGITYGGTLVLTNLGFSSYAPGQAFKIFHATTYSGVFASIVPATPALGLLWDTNTLATDGTLRVIVQPTPRPLLVLSVSSLMSNVVNVVFDTEVDQSTALDPGNYTISTGQSVLYCMMAGVTNVVLNLASPLTAPTYSVQVRNVRDLAYIPNVVATTNVPGRAWNFLASESILITNGYAFAFADKVKVYADGADIFGTSDQFQYVYNEVTGDFDVSVCLESFLITDPAAKAGIMAREIASPFGVFADDRHFLSAGFSPDPSRNNNFVQYREVNGGTVIAPGSPRPPATYPTNWLRLKRTGSVLQGFCGSNGLDWTPMSAVDSATNAAGAYPPTIRLGLAVTSHNVAQTTEAVFHSFGNARVRPALTITPSGDNVIVSWSASGLGWKLEATPSLTAPDRNWTVVPGSQSVTAMTLPASLAQRYFRLVE